jgi:hypothetical protein
MRIFGIIGFVALHLHLGACTPQRAALDPRAADALAMLRDARADVIADDAVLVGFTPGEVIRTTGVVDGNHDVFRVDIETDGKPARLFARLSASGTTLRMVAIMQEPPPSIEIHPGPAGLSHYFASWNVADDKRAGELNRGFAEEGDYIDPQASLEDRASLAAHISKFQDDVPFASIAPTSGALVRGVAARFRWVTRIGPLDVQDGEDLVLFDDNGRVTLVCGYWN